MKPVGKAIECIFKKLEAFGDYFFAFLTWLILAVLNPEHRFKEIFAQRLNPPDGNGAKSDKNPTEDVNQTATPRPSEEQCKAAKNAFESEQQRGQNLAEKNKVLLTVAALLIAGGSALSTGLEQKWVILFPLLPTIISAYLILIHFRIEKLPCVQWRKYAKSDTDDIKVAIYIDHIKAAQALDDINCYRIGVYRAAVRALLIGLLFFIPSAILLIYAPASSKTLSEELEVSPSLKELLRGPTGEKGDIGPEGETGPKGDKGERGDIGPMGQVSIIDAPAFVCPCEGCGLEQNAGIIETR